MLNVFLFFLITVGLVCIRHHDLPLSGHPFLFVVVEQIQVRHLLQTQEIEGKLTDLIPNALTYL